MINLSQFAERLNELMFDNNKTATDIATAISIHKSAIYRYLRAERIPEIDIIIKIADLFACSIDFLLGFTDQNYTTKIVICPPFSKRLAFLLEHFSITKYKLVKQTKIPESIIYSWQSGKSRPNLESITKLANYFDCSIDYILGRED